MNPQELRIGNLYKPTDGSGEYKEVTSDDIKAWSMGAIYGKEIPLSEDWLLKSGGNKDEYYRGIVIEIKLLSGREARLIFQKSGYVILHDGRKNIVIGEIPFVHQLQNIHFALSGSELTINT